MVNISFSVKVLSDLNWQSKETVRRWDCIHHGAGFGTVYKSGKWWCQEATDSHVPAWFMANNNPRTLKTLEYSSAAAKALFMCSI